MKKTLLLTTITIMALLSSCVFAQTTCPTKGSSTNLEHQGVDSLKNRSALNVKEPAIPILAVDFLKMSPDPKNKLAHSGHKNYFALTTYLVGIKYAGAESCECESKNKPDIDFHIETAAILTDPETKFIICEVTRYNKVEHPDLNFERLKTFKGKKVIITGWYFYDTEHENAAENIKSRPHNWRGTCSEIHSIESIELVK